MCALLVHPRLLSLIAPPTPPPRNTCLLVLVDTFDMNHNTFVTIRRFADVYEWGNAVLLPGLFADMGPCEGWALSSE